MSIALVGEPVFGALRGAGLCGGGRKHLPCPRHVVRVDHAKSVLPDQIGGFVTEDGLHRADEGAHRPLGIEDGNEVVGVLHESLKPLRALAHRGLGALSIGDIGQQPDHAFLAVDQNGRDREFDLDGGAVFPAHERLPVSHRSMQTGLLDHGGAGLGRGPQADFERRMADRRLMAVPQDAGKGVVDLNHEPIVEAAHDDHLGAGAENLGEFSLAAMKCLLPLAALRDVDERARGPQGRAGGVALHDLAAAQRPQPRAVLVVHAQFDLEKGAACGGMLGECGAKAGQVRRGDEGVPRAGACRIGAFIAEHAVPALVELHLAGADLPVPDAEFGALHGERQAFLRLAGGRLGAHAFGDVLQRAGERKRLARGFAPEFDFCTKMAERPAARMAAVFEARWLTGGEHLRMRRFETSPVVGMHEPQKLGEGRGLGRRLEPEEAKHLFRPGPRARFGQQFPTADPRLLLRGLQALLAGSQVEVGLPAIRDVAQYPDRPGLQMLRIKGLPHDGAPKRHARFTHHARIRGVDSATSQTFISLSAHPFVVYRVCIAARHIGPNHFARRKAEHREVSGIGPLQAAVAQQTDTARNRVKNGPMFVRHLPQLLDRLQSLGDGPGLCAECDDLPVRIEDGPQREIERAQYPIHPRMCGLEAYRFSAQGARDGIAQFGLFLGRMRPPRRFPKQVPDQRRGRLADKGTGHLVHMAQHARTIDDGRWVLGLLEGHLEERFAQSDGGRRCHGLRVRTRGAGLLLGLGVLWSITLRLVSHLG